MKFQSLIILVSLFIFGCATYVPSEMVSARYKPSKGGIVKMPDKGGQEYRARAKQEASIIMKKFCAPLQPEIDEINSSTSVSGATSSKWGNITLTDLDTEDSKLVYFSCQDKVASQSLESDLAK